MIAQQPHDRSAVAGPVVSLLYGAGVSTLGKTNVGLAL